MKFIIKSLLFVCLLLQATSSLRRCFEADQNIILTILFLSTALIGMVGLTMQNRWLLVFFAASMSLMLVASITMYGLGSGQMPLTNQLLANIKPQKNQAKKTYSSPPSSAQHRDQLSATRQAIKVGKSLQGSLSVAEQASRQQRIAQLGDNLKLHQGVDLFGRELLQVEGLWDQLSEETAGEIILDPVDTNDINKITPKSVERVIVAGVINEQMKSGKKLQQINPTKTIILDQQQQLNNNNNNDNDNDNDKQLEEKNEDQELSLLEKRKNKIKMQLDYAQYQKILSICIELAMQCLLSLWMAFLIEPSHSKSLCASFYTSNDFDNHHQSDPTSHHRHKKHHHNKQVSVYNYNGIRYSIRPDTNMTKVPMGGDNNNQSKMATLTVNKNCY